MSEEFFVRYFWFFGIVFPILLVLVSLMTTLYLTSKNLREERKLGVNCIEKDIEALAKESKEDVRAVMKVIQTSGEQTLKSIEKDGVETRQAIIGVHQSIKDELGK